MLEWRECGSYGAAFISSDNGRFGPVLIYARKAGELPFG
jgi:hypothetical protein